MATVTINISLPDTLKGKLEEVMVADGYGNASEFFRDLVRNHLKAREEKELEKLLLEGLRSGEATPLTKETFAKIRKLGLEQIRAVK